MTLARAAHELTGTADTKNVNIDVLSPETWAGTLLADLRVTERTIEHEAAAKVADLTHSTAITLVDGYAGADRRLLERSTCNHRQVWWGFAPDGLVEAVAVEKPSCGCVTVRQMTLPGQSTPVPVPPSAAPTPASFWDVRTKNADPALLRSLEKVTSVMRHWSLLPGAGELDIDPMSHLIGDLVAGLPRSTYREDTETPLIWVRHPRLYPNAD